jgi:hypothetical protein
MEIYGLWQIEGRTFSVSVTSNEKDVYRKEEVKVVHVQAMKLCNGKISKATFIHNVGIGVFSEGGYPPTLPLTKT